MLQISVLFIWIPPCHSVIAVMALWQRQKVFPSALSRPDGHMVIGRCCRRGQGLR